jgi:pyrroline-5-carboxylate reductase
MQKSDETTLFMGGGNMASAIIGGMLRSGTNKDSIHVIDPEAQTRERLERDFAVRTWPTLMAWQEQREATEIVQRAKDGLEAGSLCVVWAVKPQVFSEAAKGVEALRIEAQNALAAGLHLSVMAGVSSATIERAIHAEQVVRAMPNTPALIGQGVTGLYAGSQVGDRARARVEHTLGATGALIWFAQEEQLDAVTALSGSGPAYVFYLLEAMVAAGRHLGLSEEEAKQLTLATFSGATALAAQSKESLDTLRQRVTSKGGTTYAALCRMEQCGIAAGLQEAIFAAHQRAKELAKGV